MAWVAALAGITAVTGLAGLWLVLRFLRHVYDKGGRSDLLAAASAISAARWPRLGRSRQVEVDSKREASPRSAPPCTGCAPSGKATNLWPVMPRVMFVDCLDQRALTGRPCRRRSLVRTVVHGYETLGVRQPPEEDPAAAISVFLRGRIESGGMKIGFGAPVSGVWAATRRSGRSTGCWSRRNTTSTRSTALSSTRWSPCRSWPRARRRSGSASR